MRALHRFLYDLTDSRTIDGLGLQPDPELAARNLERAREVIARMGNKWCCAIPINREREEHEQFIQRMTQEDFL